LQLNDSYLVLVVVVVVVVVGTRVKKRF
jgi:Sec-independent protein translocase protein TatA